MSRRKKYKPNIAAVIVMTLITVGLVYAMAVRTAALQNRLNEYDSRIASLNRQIEEASEKTEELEEQRVYMQSRKYIEDMAKNILGLVEPDEILVKPSE